MSSLSSSFPRFLNLGCGAAFASSAAWLNMDIDVSPRHADKVRRYPLTLGIPFGDRLFDGVYQSHLLEHFSRGMALPFLRECLRVLRPGGVLRVVVPDVEPILRLYLECMEQARRGEPGALDRLTWMQVELFDQMTRRSSGGNMAAAWQSANEKCAVFIRSRVGSELDGLPRRPEPGVLKLPETPLQVPDADAHFLDGGELHQWMYDEVSLSALLEQAGFVNVNRVEHDRSALPDFRLDCTEDGRPRKPDSLYLEAIRPQVKAPSVPTVALFCTTDSGGAGIATRRLHEGLRAAGMPALTYTQHKKSLSPQLYVLPPTGADRVRADGRGGAVLASRALEWDRQESALKAYPHRPPHSEFFTTSQADVRLADVPLLERNNILHFHWIAGFVDVPGNADFLQGKKIVWTLHDMNPFTGGCHYAGSCRRFLENCGHCPQLGSDDPADISRQTWKRKEYAYRKLDITVVTPSRWLAEEARQSRLFSRFPIRCIPNGFPLDVFKPYPKGPVRDALGISRDSKVLLFSADHVLNNRKGLPYLLEALRLLRQDATFGDIMLLMLGTGSDALRDLGYSVKILGNLSNPAALTAAYNAADALALPSLEDNLPNVLIEALACGTPAVAFQVGGVPEIVDHGETGYLARPHDVRDLAEGLRWVLNNNFPHQGILCRTRALERFSQPLQARRYLALYQELMTGAAPNTVYPRDASDTTQEQS